MENYIKWFSLCFVIIGNINCNKKLRLKILTFADGGSDGYTRFVRSCRVNRLDVRVIGLNHSKRDMNYHINWKLNLLRESLLKFRQDKSLVLMISEATDSIIQSREEEILEKFKSFDSTIILSSTDKRRDDLLNTDYPPSIEKGYRYISTVGIIGYASAVYKMLKITDDYVDNELNYYTNIYLNHRRRYRMKLDHKADLFQHLHDNKNEIELQFVGKDVHVTNSRFKTRPALIYGQETEGSKVLLHHLSNYVPRMWSYNDGCTACYENNINLQTLKYYPTTLIKKEQWPTVLIGLFIVFPVPFIDLLLRQVSNQDYPKSKIHVFICNTIDIYDDDIKKWISDMEKEYNSIKFFPSSMLTSEKEGRNLGMFYWKQLKTDYYFNIDGIVSLTNTMTLQLLIQQNRAALAPMLNKNLNYSSNFWGGIHSNGSFDTFDDYWIILNNTRQGVWNSPFITHAYLLNSTILDAIGIDPFLYEDETLDADASFCANLRDRGIFMYVTNMAHYGHLKSSINYQAEHAHNDLYELFDNKHDWEAKYLHPDYVTYLNNISKIQQPCPDVYWVPIVTKNFANDLIGECEKYGRWSDGKHDDKRLDSGYEAVPTVDIHMNQIGFEHYWLQMLEDYFAPIVMRLYRYGSKSQAVLNFVVKYTLDGQSRLRPHHDASTYTVNMALNERNIEYDGGGARFIRYNCSVPDTKVGWALLHPGQLTHYHEGLKITRGTRYIMVSFVDP